MNDVVGVVLDGARQIVLVTDLHGFVHRIPPPRRHRFRSSLIFLNFIIILMDWNYNFQIKMKNKIKKGEVLVYVVADKLQGEGMNG